MAMWLRNQNRDTLYNPDTGYYFYIRPNLLKQWEIVYTHLSSGYDDNIIVRNQLKNDVEAKLYLDILQDKLNGDGNCTI